MLDPLAADECGQAPGQGVLKYSKWLINVFHIAHCRRREVLGLSGRCAELAVRRRGCTAHNHIEKTHYRPRHSSIHFVQGCSLT